MEAFLQVEEDILMFFQECVRNPVLDVIMKAVTFLGDKGWFWILLSVVLLAIPASRRTGLSCCVSCIFDVLLVNVLIKNIVARVRPYEIFEELTYIVKMPDDYSFPSGHSAISFAVAVVLFIRMPKKVGIPALVLASLIAVSRLYVGVHYPSDVICGIVIGIGCAILACLIVKLAGPKLDLLQARFSKNKRSKDENR